MRFLLCSLLCVGLFHTAALAQDYSAYQSYSYDQLDSLRKVFYYQGNYQEQARTYQVLREKIKATQGEQDSLFAHFTVEAGIIYNQLGNYEKALTLGHQGSTLFQQLLGDQHPIFADALVAEGNAHLELGHYESALALYQQAIELTQKTTGKERAIFAVALTNLADYHLRTGNYEQTVALCLQALDVEEQVYGRAHDEFASTLNLLAQTYYDLREYEKAITIYLEVQKIKESVLGPEHPEFTMVLNNLAATYYSLGDYEQALVLYLQIKRTDEKANKQGTLEYSTLLGNLANLYQDMGDYEQALTYYLASKKLDEKILGLEHPDLATVYNNLAYIYHDLGEYQKALLFYQKTMKIDEQYLGRAHPDLATTLCNLSYLYQDMGDYKKARLALQEALAICTAYQAPLVVNETWKKNIAQVSYPSTHHLSITLGILEAVYNFLDTNPTLTQVSTKQLLVIDLIVVLSNRLRNDLYSEKDKLRILESSNIWLRKSLNLLKAPEDAVKAFTTSDVSKSVLLLQALQAEEAYRLGNLPDSMVQQEQHLQERREQLQALLLEKRTPKEREQLQSQLVRLHQAIEHFQQQLQTAHPNYYQLKYQAPSLSTAAIQADLDDQTAFLEYVIGDSVVHIFYLDKTTIEWFKVAIDQKVLHRRIKSFREALTNYELLATDEKKAYRAYTKYAHWFFERLLQPALHNKQGIENLIIVTDGELGHLPFESFLMEEAPQELTSYHQLAYLIKEFNISYSYSAALWQENNAVAAVQNNGQIFGVAANYSLSNDSTLLHDRLSTDRGLRHSLIPLPNARKEVEALAANFKGFFAFDLQASERIIKENIAEYAILHFATHGILNRQEPVLSSLALTEDGDSLESNFWQAYEISKTNLKADLVVLSACETGYGSFEEGNGIASLARSFMYAGAPSLVVSLWQVNDYATSKIMNQFYQNLATGMKKDAALRHAKLYYLQHTEGAIAHPALWSPFIQMGNTQPVQIAQKSTVQWGWLVGMGLLFIALLFGFVGYRKRVNA